MERSDGFRAILDDRSLATALVAVQGPRSADILGPLTDVDLGALRYYAIAEGRVAGPTHSWPGTGYTGEDGFEVFVENARAGDVWDALLEAGQPAGIVPVGLGARDTLRLEAGMPLYGNDLDPTVNPYDAGLGRRRQAGQAPMHSSAAPRWSGWPPRARAAALSGSRCAGRESRRHGYPVYVDEAEIGAVTSGAPSPTLGVPIALAYVTPATAEPGTMLAVGIRDALVPAEVVPLPFYRRSD